MGIVSKFLEKRTLDVNPLDPRWWPNTMNYKVNSGAQVSEETAMRVGAVYACVHVLAWTLASLPWPIYERLKPRGKQRAVNHPLYPVLYDEPNDEQSSFTFRSTMMAHALLWGNCYAEIEFDRKGNPVALWPLPAWRTKPLRTVKGELFYRVTMPDGNIQNLPPYQIWHVAALSTDGIKGLSVISQAREAIGLGIATEEFGARFFGQGTNVGGVAEHPGKLSTNAYNNLKADLEEKYAGLGRSNRLLLLEEGMKYQKIGVPPNDAQFLETRNFQLEEICRWFGVQPHLVGDLQRATNNNIEHQGLEFVIYTMHPWFANWEQETNRKLFGIGSQYFTEFLTDSLVRGDMLARYQAYAIARNNGWFSANDVRELENQNPLPGDAGDVYLVPMNMVDASTLVAGHGPTTPIISDTGDAQQANSLTRLMQKRITGAGLLEARKRSANLRVTTAASYKRLYREAAQRIVDRETENVTRAVKKYLGERSQKDFENWLVDYYRDYQDYMQRQIKPVAQSLAEAIHSLALAEVNTQAPHLQPHVDNFVNDYTADFAKRYASSSQGQLKQVVAKAIEAKDGDAGGEVVRRLDEWQATRPDKVAMNETVQLAGAVARMAFAGAGVTKLMWAAQGGKNCPYCQEMDGRVVEITKDFESSGDSIDAEGQTMEVYHSMAHPPLHQNCSCTIMPV